MRTDFWYPSCAEGRIHGCSWVPEGTPKAIVQIVHGITEHVLRYDVLGNYLAARGYLVVAEDHMGHGASVNGNGIDGYFHGGWFAAVEDSQRLLWNTKAEHPDIPYFLLGHSMGSFMARTMLYRYPDSGLSGVILSGTAWQPTWMLPGVCSLMKFVCRMTGETRVNDGLLKTAYDFLNRRVENPETNVDWVCANRETLSGHSMLHGHQPSVGLLRDMVTGVREIQKPVNLARMQKDLPLFLISGEEDPVGEYGRGIHKCVQAFRKAGMTNVKVKLYPQCRHEVLNEVIREDVFGDVLAWMEEKTKN